MFLTCDQNRLPVQTALAGEGATVSAIAEIWSGGDALILQFSRSGERGHPRTVMMDLIWGASSLGQFATEGQVVRKAALLIVKPHGGSSQLSFETLREIRIGVTELREAEERYVKVAQFTTSGGRQFSVPFAIAHKASRGKRIYREGTRGSQAKRS
jgi:hypothetical protein